MPAFMRNSPRQFLIPQELAGRSVDAQQTEAVLGCWQRIVHARQTTWTRSAVGWTRCAPLRWLISP